MKMRCPAAAYWADLGSAVDEGDVVDVPSGLADRLTAQNWTAAKDPKPKSQPKEVD